MSHVVARATPPGGGAHRLATALVAGALAIALQQILLRELAAAHGEHALFTGIELAVWFAMTGVGAVLPSPRRLVTAQTALALQVVAGAAGLLLVRAWTGPDRPSIAGLFVIAALASGPAAAAGGAVFARLVEGVPAWLAAGILAMESLGSAAGAGLVHLGRAWYCPATAQVGALAAAVVSWLVWCLARAPRAPAPLDPDGRPPGSPPPHGARGRVALVAALAGGGVAGVLAHAGAIDHATAAWGWRPMRLVAAIDTPLARVALVGHRREGHVLLVDRFPMFSDGQDAPHNEGLIHLALLAHPAPRRVLIVGGGVGGGVREALKHDPVEVVVCEIEPLVTTLGRTVFAHRVERALDDPRVVTLAMDAGRYLVGEPTRFDVIVLDLPDPYSPQLARFYTREAFARMAAHLEPGGLVVLQLPSPVGDPDAQEVNRVIARTFRDVFGGATAYFARMDYLLGGLFDPPGGVVLARRYLERGIRTRYLDARWLLSNGAPVHRRFRVGYLEETGEDLPLATEDRPVALAYDIFFWGAIGHGGLTMLARTLTGAGTHALAAAVMALVLLVGLLVRLAGRAGGPPLAAGAGMAAMGLFVLGLYLLQLAGEAFAHRLPAMTAAFLVGHALGALVGTRTRGPGGWTLGLALLAATGPALAGAGEPTGAAGRVGALLSLAGLLTGGLYGALLSAASARGLYAADLMGSAIAAWIVVPVALPLLGARATGVLLAAGLVSTYGFFRR